MCQACVRLKLECDYPAPGQERKNRKRKSYFHEGRFKNESDDQDQDQEMLPVFKHEYHPHHDHDARQSPPFSRTYFAAGSRDEKVIIRETSNASLLEPHHHDDDISDAENGPPRGKKMHSECTDYTPVNSAIIQPIHQLHMQKQLRGDPLHPYDQENHHLIPNVIQDTINSSHASTFIYTGLHPMSGQPLVPVIQPEQVSHPSLDYPVAFSNSTSAHVHAHHAHAHASSSSSNSSSSSSPAISHPHINVFPIDGFSSNSSEPVEARLNSDYIPLDNNELEQRSIILARRKELQLSGHTGFNSHSHVEDYSHGMHLSNQTSRIVDLGDPPEDDSSCDSSRKSQSAALIRQSKIPFEGFDLGALESAYYPGSPPMVVPDGPNKQFFFNSTAREFSDTLLMTSPTPWYELQLDKVGISMFEYYMDYLANSICVTSGTLNSFLEVFIPMAQEDVSVLYALVAYSSFHHTMGKHEDVGIRYLNKAMEMVRTDLHHHKLTTLACILIIATAEICNGDMLHWSKHLEAAAVVIEMNGGLETFVDTKAKRWLATNFFYHDVLGASRYARKTFFPSPEYNEVLRSDLGVNSLIGCCKSIFFLMAELTDLAEEAQNIHALMDTDDRKLYSTGLRKIYARARDLEVQIDNCQPDSLDIVSLSAKDQEEQLTLFETFQLTAKLQVKHSVLRYNAASLTMQILTADLVESLDVVLETKVQGSIMFPLFMATIMATRPQSRSAMLDRFDGFYKRNLARNILRAKMLAQEVWELDCEGTKYVNWYGLIQEKGLDICFS